MGNGKSLNMARCSPSISSPTTNKIIVQLKQKLKFNNSCGHSCPFYYRGMECKSRMKRCPFHYRGLECKSRKSRNTWSNRQIWPWSTEWSRAKANRVLPTERTGHSKHPPQTTILPFCVSFAWGWSWSLPLVQCYEPPSIVLQVLCLSDLIPWLYLSFPLYNHKEFDLGHTCMA